MRKLFLTFAFFLLALPAFAQSTPGVLRFPANADDADSLIRAANNVSSTLNGSITSGSSSIVLGSGSAFPATGVLSIDSELIIYTSKSTNTFSGLTRGAFSTSAASHSNGAAVRLNILAQHHSIQTDAILALEAKLGTSSSTPAADTVLQGTGSGTSAWSSLTGTASTSFNLGKNASSGSGNFDITVSSAGTKPRLRYNGSTGKWQYSDDGSAFTNLSAASGVSSVNSLTGALTVAIGSTGSGPNISASGTTVTVNIPEADANTTTTGTVNSDQQYFAGLKIFNDGITVYEGISVRGRTDSGGGIGSLGNDIKIIDAQSQGSIAAGYGGFRVINNGDVIAGLWANGLGTANPANSTTGGFLYLTTLTGTPSGTPVGYNASNYVYTRPLVLEEDTTNGFYSLYGYFNGAWRKVARAALDASASIDFTALTAQTCEDFTVTVTGAVDGDKVIVGVPNSVASIAGTTITGYVSAADTVKVRRCNLSSSTTSNPAAVTVKVQVVK